MRRALAGILAGVMTTALATAFATFLGTLPARALDGPGRALVAANTLQIANNPVQSATQNGSVGRSFIPPYSGTVRVKWEIKSKDGTGVLAEAGVPHLSNCSITSTSTAYVAQSCDLRVAGGMPVNISAAANEATNTVYLRNVSLSYKVVNADGEAITYELPAVD